MSIEDDAMTNAKDMSLQSGWSYSKIRANKGIPRTSLHPFVVPDKLDAETLIIIDDIEHEEEAMDAAKLRRYYATEDKWDAISRADRSNY